MCRSRSLPLSHQGPHILLRLGVLWPPLRLAQPLTRGQLGQLLRELAFLVFKLELVVSHVIAGELGGVAD